MYSRSQDSISGISGSIFWSTNRYASLHCNKSVCDIGYLLTQKFSVKNGRWFYCSYCNQRPDIRIRQIVNLNWRQQRMIEKPFLDDLKGKEKIESREFSIAQFNLTSSDSSIATPKTRWWREAVRSILQFSK